MISPDLLAEQIQSTGFSCTCCARCCGCTNADCGLVMVSANEIREISAATGLAWKAIAEPYPASIQDRNGGRYTLGWCLRRNSAGCSFLTERRCTIYESRPWICRTYPFMLDGDELVISECDGLGQPVSMEDALRIASDLIRRNVAEKKEAYLIREVLAGNRIPAGFFVVVDSDGMKVIDG